jgi:hypothetical protein
MDLYRGSHYAVTSRPVADVRRGPQVCRLASSIAGRPDGHTGEFNACVVLEAVIAPWKKQPVTGAPKVFASGVGNGNSEEELANPHCEEIGQFKLEVAEDVEIDSIMHKWHLGLTGFSRAVATAANRRKARMPPRRTAV